MITNTKIREIEKAAYRLARYNEPPMGTRWFMGQVFDLSHRIKLNVALDRRWPSVPQDFKNGPRPRPWPMRGAQEKAA